MVSDCIAPVGSHFFNHRCVHSLTLTWSVPLLIDAQARSSITDAIDGAFAVALWIAIDPLSSHRP